MRGDKNKKDTGKLMWDLLPYCQVRKVVSVLTFGAGKYSSNTWQDAKDGKARYYAAAMRHITDWWLGERNDSESGIHHLAHAACNLFFLLWLDEREERISNERDIDA